MPWRARWFSIGDGRALAMHLEHCKDCDHRSGRRCEHPHVGAIAFLPAVRYRHRGVHLLELVPQWCPLGDIPWPEDKRSIPEPDKVTA